MLMFKNTFENLTVTIDFLFFQTVMPKQGRVLIWPSVLDEDPNQPDPRTLHEALVVEKGVKYGANAWIHMRNFFEPWSRGCA